MLFFLVLEHLLYHVLNIKKNPRNKFCLFWCWNWQTNCRWIITDTFQHPMAVVRCWPQGALYRIFSKQASVSPFLWDFRERALLFMLLFWISFSKPNYQKISWQKGERFSVQPCAAQYDDNHIEAIDISTVKCPTQCP